LEVVLEDPSRAGDAVGALAAMAAEPPSVQDGTVVALLRHRKGAVAEAVRRMDAAGVGVDDLSLRRPTLDDVFLVLPGRPAEQEAEDEEGRGGEAGEER